MNYKLTITMLFVLILFFSQKVFTQTTVTGHVTDAKTGVPLPGATIRVEGATVGVSSGLDGKYTLIFLTNKPKEFIEYLSKKGFR